MNVAADEFQPLYDWVDGISLSRPKSNISRDFADGVLVAEVVKAHCPRLVELHNYSSANGLAQKMYNWNTLNMKVFKRLGFVLAKSECEACCRAEIPEVLVQVGAVERVLKLLKIKVEEYKLRARQRSDSSETGSETGSPLAIGGSLDSARSTSLPHQTAPAASVAVTINSLGKGHGKGTQSSKDSLLQELQAANEILLLKAQKLERLVKLKDAKIQTLCTRLQDAGLE